MHSLAVTAAVAVLLATGACAPTPAPPSSPWQSQELQDHPLAGQIWSVAQRRFVAPHFLAANLRRADLVLLGETHDNPDHHRIQAWAVAGLTGADPRFGLAIEMIREDQQATLDAHLAARPGDGAGIGPALRWQDSGWPDWHYYRPVVAPFAEKALPIRAANLSSDRIREVARGGFDAFRPAHRARLGLDRPVPDEVLKEVAAEMVDAHCGHIPAERALPFARIQIARDAVMAAALREAARQTGKGVLVAGTGHVRSDRGVPFHLLRQGAMADVVVLAPIEVQEGRTTPQDYAEAFAPSGLPFDYVWFTPRQRRGDPCLEFLPKKQ